MGLIQPFGPSWAYCTHNLPATVDAAALGAIVTAGASNADGSAVGLFGAALTHDVEYLRLVISADSPSSANNDILLSVLIDPAGGASWTTLIPYLMAGSLHQPSTVATGLASPPGAYDFPIWVPAGASLGVQARTAHTSTLTVRVLAFAHGGNANPASWWCGRRVEAIGINAAASTGQSHAPGSTGVFSSWTNLGSPLTADCGALQWGVNSEGDSFNGAFNYQFEFGAGGNRIGPPVFRTLTTSENGWLVPTGPIFKKLPAGEQLQVRGTSNGSGNALGVAAYAVY